MAGERIIMTGAGGGKRLILPGGQAAKLAAGGTPKCCEALGESCSVCGAEKMHRYIRLVLSGSQLCTACFKSGYTYSEMPISGPDINGEHILEQDTGWFDGVNRPCTYRLWVAGPFTMKYWADSPDCGVTPGVIPPLIQTCPRALWDFYFGADVIDVSLLGMEGPGGDGSCAAHIGMAHHRQTVSTGYQCMLARTLPNAIGRCRYTTEWEYMYTAGSLTYEPV